MIIVVSCAVVWPGAVTMIVLAVVTTEGEVGLGVEVAEVIAGASESLLESEFAFALELLLEFEFDLESESESEFELCWLSTLLLRPVS